MAEPVEISEKALKEIKKILEKKGIPDGYGLRMGVAGGRGCSGVEYTLGFDKEKEDDQTYEIGGVSVHIQKAQMMFLIGKTVDFYEGSDAKGFLFTDGEKSIEKD